MSKRHKDFDAYRKEKNQTPVTFTLFEKEWILPPNLSYDTMLDLKALARREDKETRITDEEVDTLLLKILGKKVLSDLREYAEFDYELAYEILGWVMDEYMMRNVKEEDSDPKLVAVQEVVTTA